MTDYPAYAEIDQDTFNEKLAELVDDETGESLLAIPGIYEVLSEYFNNDVLDAYDDDNSHFMTYETAVESFESEILPGVAKQYGPDDQCAIDQAWNDWTDMLHRDLEISDYAYDQWTYDYNYQTALEALR